MLCVSSKLRSLCHVTVLPRQHLTITVNTVVPPSAEIVPPTEDIVGGNLVRFQCLVTQGTEPVKIKWYYGNYSRLPEGAVNDSDVLTFAGVQPHHSGIYICSVSNSWGSVEVNATLSVQG